MTDAPAHDALTTTTLEELAAAIDTGHQAVGQTADPLVNVMLACCAANGMRPDEVVIEAAVRNRPTTPRQAAAALGIAVRAVDTAASGDWQESNIDPMAVCIDGAWLAAVPQGRSRAVITSTGRRRPLSADEVGRVDRTAWAVLPTLPEAALSIRALMRLGWTRPSSAAVGALLVWTAVGALLGVVVPLMTGRIVGTLVPTGEVERIWIVTGTLVVMAVAAGMVLSLQALIVNRLSTRIALRITQAALDRLLHLPLSFHRQFAAGSLAQRISNVESWRSALAGVVPPAITALGLVVGDTIVLIAVDWQVALALLGSIAVLAIGLALTAPGYVRHASRFTQASNDLSGLTLAMMLGVAKIQSSGALDRMGRRWLRHLAVQQWHSRALLNRSIVVFTASATLPAFAALVLVALTVLRAQSFSIGVFTVAVSASAQVAAAVAVLMPAIFSLLAQWPDVGGLAPLVAMEPATRGTALLENPVVAGAIEFRDVHFSYVPGSPVIDGVSLTIAAGSVCAIVGPSGSGKSTLARLMIGLERPDSGAITLDGRSLSDISPDVFRTQVAVVPQDGMLATGTIAQNVGAGLPGASTDDIWAALQGAGIADEVRAMPMGINTLVSQGGATFSGGQRQRILIARALVKRPSLVILDEATSALDNLTQAMVGQSLAQLGCTRVVIAHRLSTVRQASVVVVIDHGRIAERGTYDELIARGGLFASLAARQTAGADGLKTIDGS